MKPRTKIFFAGFTALASVAAGCSFDWSGPVQDSDGPPISFRMIPADNATEVPVDASIILSFSRPVNRDVIELNVHLISELETSDSLCPLASSMTHGSMDTMMANPTTMEHLFERHRTPGVFNWNWLSTDCTFTPHEKLRPRSRYMVHFGGEMTQMMQGGGNHMVQTEGHGTEMMSSGRTFHFWTRR